MHILFWPHVLVFSQSQEDMNMAGWAWEGRMSSLGNCMETRLEDGETKMEDAGTDRLEIGTPEWA